ncbi:MAG: bifunctional riboflavin kinase/FAD synthetase [Pseudomonadota bacterium]
MMKFQRLVDPASIPSEWGAPVVAIGNFDGVHRGHQIVLETAKDIAARRGTAAIALTFEPHPRSFFKPEEPVYRLTPAPIRARVVEALDLDGVVELTFDRAFSSRTASSFVTDILLGRLRASDVVTGYDFHFGKGREGSPEFLIAQGRDHGFGVTVVPAQKDEGDAVVSSSRIRGALANADVAEAAGLLGYRPIIEAEIVPGAQLGRTLGYPTANMSLLEGAALAHGIYAVRFRRADGTLHDGVASYGRRPTINSGAPLLETYVFDFSGDLYGEVCSVTLFSYLRGEEKFDSVDDLIVQMDKDSQEARAVLTHATPITPLDGRLSFDLEPQLNG